MHISVRAATSADDPFLSELFDAVRGTMFAGMAADVVGPLLRQQEAAQRHGYTESFPGATHEIVEVDGRPVGRWLVDRRPDAITLVDIAVHPDVQGRGIGTELLSRIIEQSDAAGTSIRLSVALDNRARHLYERMGFHHLTTQGAYVQMERNAAAGHRDAGPGISGKDAS